MTEGLHNTLRKLLCFNETIRVTTKPTKPQTENRKPGSCSPKQTVHHCLHACIGFEHVLYSYVLQQSLCTNCHCCRLWKNPVSTVKQGHILCTIWWPSFQCHYLHLPPLPPSSLFPHYLKRKLQSMHSIIVVLMLGSAPSLETFSTSNH